MKPEVKKLVTAFAETAQSVKIRLKKSGFVLPVAHNGGIKFKHCFIKKNNEGWYNVVNLHNTRKIYYKNIASHKIAVAIAIYLGMDRKYPENDLLEADRQYLHYFNEIRFLKHNLGVALKKDDTVKIDLYNARIQEYMPKYERAKHRVALLLDRAETLLFDTK